MDQEAHRAGEFVILLGDNVNRQFFLRKVCTGKLKILCGLIFILVDICRTRIIATRLQLLNGVFSNIVVILTRCILIGGHYVLPFLSSCIALPRNTFAALQGNTLKVYALLKRTRAPAIKDFNAIFEKI